MLIETPIGPLHAVFDEEERLAELSFQRTTGFSLSMGRLKPALRQQLLEYFDGRRRTFDFPLAPKGTPFQLDVWNALLEVPYGDTVTYAELARRIGRPSAIRAVGAANGANPIPVIIPCHRVIGSNGTLTGYGGGIERKQWLLALEGRRLF
ncbi:MAG TPA: methylated-DNA--[protein]-cysteine S-methyltransferase [Thermoanaerobaculia bacterium]